MALSDDELSYIHEEKKNIYQNILPRSLTQIRYFSKCAELEIENSNEVVHYNLSKIAKGWIRMRGYHLSQAKMNIQLPGKAAIQTKLKLKYEFKHLRKILYLIKELINEEELGFQIREFEYENDEDTPIDEHSPQTSVSNPVSTISSTSSFLRPSPLTNSTVVEEPPIELPTKILSDTKFVVQGKGYEIVPILDFPFDEVMFLEDLNQFILNLQKIQDYMTKSIEKERIHFQPSLGRGVKFKLSIVDARIDILLTRGVKEKYSSTCDFKTLHRVSNLLDEATTVAFRLQRKIQVFDQLNQD
mmetsp:Transcript_7975/g.11849  ORF Transcript_7975/g.11849 Transcript_7975/m.11849 type:complete len:301 (+) Transcript_7975:90-992(+)